VHVSGLGGEDIGVLELDTMAQVNAVFICGSFVLMI
jgi:hypothetical protein